MAEARSWSIQLWDAPRETVLWVLFDSNDEDPYVKPMTRLAVIEEWTDPQIAAGRSFLRYRLVDYDAKTETEYVDNFTAKAWRAIE